MLVIIGINALVSTFIYWTTFNIWVFGVTLCIVFFVSSGITPNVAVGVVMIFGKDLCPRVFSYMYVSVTLAGATLFLMVRLAEALGYIWTWWVCSISLSMSFVLLFSIEYKFRLRSHSDLDNPLVNN